MVSNTGFSAGRVRIVHVVNTFGFGGGAERHVLALVAGQVAAGHEVGVAYLKETTDAAGYSRQLRLLGVDAQALGDDSKLPIAAARRLARLVTDRQPDVVHSHLPRADIACATARRLPAWQSDAICMSSVHNDEEFFRRVGLRQLLSLTYRSFDHVIAISSRVAGTLTNVLRVPAARVSVVPYGVEPRIVAPTGRLRNELGLAANTPVIGTLARVTRQKGIDILLHAVAQLERDVHTVVVGPDEPDAPALHRLAADLGVDERVHFLGFRSDAAELLAEFDVFCLPARWEGFGLVLLEAGLAAVPIVASDIGPINEIVSSGDGGWLVAPERSDLLAEALREAISDRAEALRRAASQQARVLGEYTADRMVAGVEAAYLAHRTSQRVTA